MNIYAYTLSNDATKTGLIKVGQAGDSDKRIKEQIGATRQHYEKVFDQSALAGKWNISDHDVHRLLVERGFERVEGEWFRCTPDDVKDALDFLKQKYINEDKRNELTEKFYEELRNWYFWATEEQYQGMFKREHDPDHALRIIIRLLLIFFLQEKELVPAELFDEDWLNEHLEENEHKYYNAVLRNLFFYSLNTPQNKRGELEHRKLIKHYNKVKEQLHKRIPFLNGGLFNEAPGDDFALSNKYFFSSIDTVTIKALDGRYPVKGLVAILKDYKYTLDETDNTEYIDPEFIGKIFESLLACIEADSKESRRKVTGSYYTPREIVDYMVNEALDAYLETADSRRQTAADREKIGENLLLRCSILEPACGSGAFPCGVMNAIMKRIDPNKTYSQSERYAKKLEILRKVIYGVDIQPMAVQITVFRLFLSLIQEIKPTNNVKENFGIEPLPNLDYKFCCANALIGINGNGTFFHEHLGEFNQIQVLKSDYFNEDNTTARERLKLRIENIEQEIAAQFQSDVIKFQRQVDDLENIIAGTTNEAERDGLEKRLVKIKERLQKMISAEAIAALCEWNHSDTTPSPYFDSRWMFGIEKFDIVIGNPPFVRADNAGITRQRKQILQSKQYETLWEKWDLMVPFFERGLKMLKNKGTLYLVASNALTTSKYAEKLQQWIVKNHYVRSIDYDITLFHAEVVAVLINIAANVKGDKTKKIFRNAEFQIASTQDVDNTNVNDLESRVFRKEYTAAFISDIETVKLGSICYISVGMVINADEKMAKGKHKGKFKREDLISDKKDKIHCKRYIENKDLLPFGIKQIKYLEYGTSRVPGKIRRKTFPELYTGKKIMKGYGNYGTIDDTGILCNHSINIFKRWVDLHGIENKSIRGSLTKYNKGQKRSELESLSADYDLRFILGIMNSSFATAYINNIRRSSFKGFFYPDEYRNFPIPKLSIRKQQPLIKLVERQLNGEPVDDKIDALVYELYGLTTEEIRLIESP